MRFRSLLALFLIGAAFSTGAAEPDVDSSQLPRIPPTPPDKAVSTFKVKPGFRIELVAAEPLVVSPVAMSFDEDGRLYVIEMRDYSERRPERLGRVRRLEDTDGDGRFDKSTVFADGLPWPTAVTCWAGGVFVGATPDILWMKDTTGDGVADEREVIFTGFASDYAPFATNKLNVQALMNSFQWTLDNRIHGATSFSGGKVSLVDSPFTRDWRRRGSVAPPSPGGEGRGEGEPNPPGSANIPLDLRGRDFSFDPRTLSMRPESGGGQHGMSFDNRGRKFVCSNSDHIQQIVYEDRYAARNPYYTMPSPRVSIAADGPAAEVFRISPDEPWRVLRTQWRVAGKVPGPVEGGGRASGYFTGATGVTIYRGDAYGEEFVGDAFIGDAGGNLVHRKKLIPDGILLRAERPADEQKVEFLASTDNWFRPVQFANAPDGCLYIADMYREVIEHPWSLPPNLKKHLDLNSGNDRGRIYRIVPENFKQRPQPRLSKAGTTDLVKFLEHSNGWHRDTAARLICERRDHGALSRLGVLVLSQPDPALDSRPNFMAVLHGLHLLSGFGALKDEHVIAGLTSQDAPVQMSSLKLAEPFIANRSPSVLKALRSIRTAAPPVDEGRISFHFQLAMSLGELSGTNRVEALAGLLHDWYLKSAVTRQVRTNDLRWLIAAAASSSGDEALALARTVRTGPASNRLGNQHGPGQLTFYPGLFAELGRLIGGRNESNELVSFIGMAGTSQVDAMAEYLSGLEAGLGSRVSQLHIPQAQASLEHGFRNASWHASTNWSTSHRISAISVLGYATYAVARSNLIGILSSTSEASDLRQTALRTMARPGHSEFADDVLGLWRQLTSPLRADAIALLLKRPDWTLGLLAAVKQERVALTEVSVVQQTQLRSHRDTEIRERATRLFGRAATAARQSVVDAFQPALGLKGDTANGRTIFQARCASCHKLGSEGHALGPDLATVKSGGKEKLLIAILDPNREVAPNFAGYTVETKDGESLTGVLASEGANSVTLRMAGGAESVVARANITSMQSQGRSLMPEGLEEGLKPQDMADLLKFTLAP